MRRFEVKLIKPVIPPCEQSPLRVLFSMRCSLVLQTDDARSLKRKYVAYVKRNLMLETRTCLEVHVNKI
jgi:hypothetical protein